MASLSTSREAGPRLLFRLLDLELTWEGLDRKKLLLLDSFSSGVETIDVVRSNVCSTSHIGSGRGEYITEEEAGEGGGGKAALIRVLDIRCGAALLEKVFERPLGLNRPAVA